MSVDLTTILSLSILVIACITLAVTIYAWKRSEFNRRFKNIETSLIQLSDLYLYSLNYRLDKLDSDQGLGGFANDLMQYAGVYQDMQRQKQIIQFEKINLSLAKKVEKIYDVYWVEHTKLWEKLNQNQSAIILEIAKLLSQNKEYLRLIKDTKLELDKFINEHE